MRCEKLRSCLRLYLPRTPTSPSSRRAKTRRTRHLISWIRQSRSAILLWLALREAMFCTRWADMTKRYTSMTVQPGWGRIFPKSELKLTRVLSGWAKAGRFANANSPRPTSGAPEQTPFHHGDHGGHVDPQKLGPLCLRSPRH